MEHIYDLIIIGGGPGGYTAALYGARAGLDTLVIERLSAGGQMALTAQIDNYPGFDEGIDGFTLGQNMQAGAERFGAKSEMADVLRLDLKPEIKVVETTEGTFYARTVAISTGAAHRELGLPNEQALVGRGVNYCAVADALLLSRVAKKVILVHRRDSLRATKIYHKALMEAPNVEFRWNSAVSELLADEKLYAVRLKDVRTGEQTMVDTDGIFVSIGRKPTTELVKDQLALDEAGYIIADESTKTSIPGVFAVGDVRTKQVRQVVTAVADGAVAVHEAEEYLAQHAGT